MSLISGSDDVLEIKSKIKKNLTDRNFRSNLIKNGNFHFKKFNWEHNVSKTLSVISNINTN